MTTHRLKSRLSFTIDRLARRLEHSRVCAQLSMLDDRMLKDIGVSRAEVEAMRRNGGY